jgi:hypothetical protein
MELMIARATMQFSNANSPLEQKVRAVIFWTNVADYGRLTARLRRLIPSPPRAGEPNWLTCRKPLIYRVVAQFVPRQSFSIHSFEQQ